MADSTATGLPPSSSIDLVHARPSRWRVIGRSAELWVPLLFLVGITLACFLLPVFGRLPDPTASTPAQANLPLLSNGHPLGTDPVGFDVFSRLVHGGRLSLEVGVGAALVGLVTGGTVGVVAGYRGGFFDTVVSRCLDVLLAFPSLVLAMTIATYLGPNVVNVILAISFFSIPAFARLARASTQRLREHVFVTAARLSGTRTPRLIVGHVAPNVLPELLTYALLSVAHAVLIEASLSFLGLGVRPPAPSWGSMIAIGQQNIYTNQSLLLIPSIALFLTVMALNLLGDAVRTRWVAR